jgi:hypothetical protein
VDDDNDGRSDAVDPGCSGPSDPSERTPALTCDNGLDDDGDGRIDFPADPGCASPSSPAEDPACSNGWDDDGDGKIDFPEDEGCRSVASNRENPACSDGWDDDGDGRIDWNGGPDGSPPDPDCQGTPWLNHESRGCGLGAELAPLLTLLARRFESARRRRRH